MNTKIRYVFANELLNTHSKQYFCFFSNSLAHKASLLPSVFMLNSSKGSTPFLISITVLTTLLAWYNPAWQDLFIGYPYKAYHFSEWYRCFTKGLIHANIPHLLLNMYVLHSFGNLVEGIYTHKMGNKGVILYLLLYIGGIISAGIADVWFHAHNAYYQSLGASAGIAAVVLSAILFNPSSKILFYGFILMPSWLYAIGYLLLSYYTIGHTSSINHLAHLVGSLYGILFTLASHPHLPIVYVKFLKKIFS